MANETAKLQDHSRKPSSEDRLNSWKEIAAYLKCSERTVRRWEAEGLPVQRRVHNKRASIYAFKAEVDAWWEDGRKRLELEIPAVPLATLPTRGSWLRPKRLWLPAVGLVVLAAVAFMYRGEGLRRRSFSPATPSIRAIAILPLRNLSGNPGYDYLADGLTEELTTRIARIPSLRVVSSTSVRQFRGTTVPLPQIARELNVDAVIEGSVLRSGNRIRITTQLVDARTDSHLWAQSYERDIGESLEIQDSAALDIANQVRVTLTPRQRQPFEARRSVTPDAYEAYLKGIYFQNRQTPDDVQSAIRFFRTATEKDPGYAAAYARLADAYMLLAFVSEVPSAEAFTRARESAEKALSLDESLDEGHVEVANIAFFHDWDWRKAEGEFKRAIELNPNSASARYTYPILLLVSGRSKQSVEEARAAQALDPVSPSSYLVAVSVAYYSRQYDDGLRLARAALELYPNNPVLRVLHGNEGFAIFLANVVNRADVVMI